MVELKKEAVKDVTSLTKAAPVALAKTTLDRRACSLTNFKILIFDEATSSVDTRLELLIQKITKRLMKGRASFVIAHRLQTIQEVNKILVLKDGQIIEQGNHESLL